MARFVFYWLLVPPLFFLGFASIASEYPDKVFWGDTHIHTALSGDASAAGVALDLEAAYRFAKGEVCCLLYTSPSPRDSCASRMPSSA